MSLVHVALKIHSDSMSTPGHAGLSMSEKDAIACVPESLFMFLNLLLGGQTILEDETDVADEDCVCRRVLRIVQDLIYCISGGKKWTPKHMGLECILHQTT